MSSPQAFSSHIPEERLNELQERLALTRFPDELENAEWDYGVPLTDIQRLVNYWKKGFDWKKQEAVINALPQFTTDISVENFGTLNIHYVHKRSSIKTAIPLLFVHGWPGSFLEVTKLLPILTEASPDSPNFDVVALSLPGFGFSEGPKKKGFGISQYAEVGHKLMQSLGYSEYVTQGGDWGSAITREIGHLYGGKHCKAIHLNMIVSDPPKLSKNPILWLRHSLQPYTTEERLGLKRMKWFRERGMGYFNEQATQPQTLGYSLADSPVGLLAWIYEKMRNWTDEYPWTDDEILTWVSIYWFSRAGAAASLRIYYEYSNAKPQAVELSTGNALVGLSWFPKDLFVVPRTWGRTIGRVIFESSHSSGGHFAAYEKPKELASDLFKMFGKGGPAFGVVAGDLDGYQTA